MADESIPHVIDQRRVRHVLLVGLEVDILGLMDIFWLNIDLLVLFHHQFHFITEWAAPLWEVAAQLDKVEDAELVSTTVTDESEDKFAHGILLGLFVVALTILFGSGIFVDIFFSFLLWPENLQP